MTAGPDPVGSPVRTFRTGDGRTLSYGVSGSGPTVVLVPGGPGLDPTGFYAGTVLPGFTQVVLCPRGTGESDPPVTPDGYRIAGFVEDVEALRAHLGLDRLALYGCSHGSSVVLAYAGAHPDRVERMVLANGPAHLDASFREALDREREHFRREAEDGARRLDDADAAARSLRSAADEASRLAALRTTMDAYVARLGDVESAYLDRLLAAPTNFAAPGPMAAEMVGGLNLLATAGGVRAPALVLGGDLDARVPVEHLQEVTDALPDARLDVFAGAGHLLHVEARERWTRTVGEFLRAA